MKDRLFKRKNLYLFNRGKSIFFKSKVNIKLRKVYLYYF